MAELTPSAPETGATSPVSVGACAPSRVSASCSGCACCAPSEPNSIGSVHCKASPSTPKSCCIAPIEPGALNTPPTQSSPGPRGVDTSSRSGASRVASAVQNAEEGFTGATIPVTTRVILDVRPVVAIAGPVVYTLDPGCSPNCLAVAADTAIWKSEVKGRRPEPLAAARFDAAGGGAGYR